MKERVYHAALRLPRVVYSAWSITIACLNPGEEVGKDRYKARMV